MHAYVYAMRRQPTDRPDGLVTRMYMPDLALFLKADRTAVRETFIKTFGTLFKRLVRVRFEDECEVCGDVKDVPDGNIDHHCMNPQCSNGFPPRHHLGDLMKRYKYLPGETASQWADRLTGIWKKESSDDTV